MELLDQIQAIVREAETALASAKTENDVETIRAKTIGRNGAFTALGPLMGKIPPEEKPVAGRAFNEAKQTLLAKIEESRQRGAIVTCDQYPYPATSTILSALLPRRAYDGGAQAMLKRVSTPDASLLQDIADEMDRRGGAAFLPLYGHKASLRDQDPGRSPDRRDAGEHRKSAVDRSWQQEAGYPCGGR